MPLVNLKELLANSLKKQDNKDSILKFEIETLISNFLSIDRIDIYLKGEVSITISQYQELDSLISRRLKGEPLSYILSYAYFRDLKLKVGPGVLIPRPETEKMIEIAKEFIFPDTKVIDVGTGSGAIALSIAKEFPQTHVIGIDISSKALNYAERNKKLNEISNAEFRINDLCSGFEPTSVDIILANLPYIPYPNYLNLDKDVKNYEPELALTSGNTGLELIEKLVSQSVLVLKPSGIIILEIDKDQGNKVSSLFFRENVFSDIKIFKDYNNLDRFVLAQKLKVN